MNVFLSFFLFSICFLNIFSDENDKIKFILNVQEVERSYNNKEYLVDLYTEVIYVDRNSFIKVNYKPEELLIFFYINKDEEFKKKYISNKNILVKIGADFYFKPDIIYSDRLKKIDNNKESVEIFYRDKRKYDLKMYNRFFVKDIIKIRNKTFTKEDFINICNRTNIILNNDYCCFLKGFEFFLIFSKNNVEFRDRLNLFTFNYKNELSFLNPDYYKTCNFKIFDKNNNYILCDDFVMCKNLYYSLQHLLKIVLNDYNLKYQDIEYIKYNKNCEFKFENEDFKNIENLEEKLYNTNLDENNISEIKLKIDFKKGEESGISCCKRCCKNHENKLT